MNDKHPLRKEKYENFKKAASLPFGKRVAYYLNFFKFPIGGIVVIGIIIYFYLSQVIFAPKIILNGYIVNRTEIPVMTDEEFMSSFPGYSKINQRKEKICFSSDMFLNENDTESAFKIIATVSSGEVDYLICNENTLDKLAELGLLEDLNKYPDIIQSYNDSLLTYDHTANETNEDDSLGMRTYGIDIKDSKVLKEFNAFKEGENIYLCIGKNADLSDTAKEFITWVCK